ncbi:MAG: GNAT family N-acetyltransferase, partial [Anaerolineales bacterium]
GLILRRAVPADADRLSAFNAEIHREPNSETPDHRIDAWTRELLQGDHPTFKPGDFTIVEDTHTGAIVSSLNLISQRWTYAGIEFGVGRPELVGTHPEYRNRGLVRAQFEVMHQWSAERGEIVQGITGIPYYYRQFGYEMGLALGGGRSGYEPNVPKLKEGEAEPYRLRPASEADLPFIMQTYAEAMQRSLVACVRDEALWRYELFERNPDSVGRRELRVIESTDGRAVGLSAHPPFLWRSALAVTFYELAPGFSWLAVTPSVARYLWASGLEYAQREGKKLEGFAFHLGAEHPVYLAVPDRLSRTWNPYAWYVRVPDLPGFLRHIAPALERRLAGSIAVGYSGELKLSFYRTGLRLVLENGRLAGAESWQPRPGDDGVAAFPDLSFLQLLFGYRSLEELEYAFKDCWVDKPEARVLLNVLFPKQNSNVWPVE